ncbi:MAG: hypothetical protein IJD52_02180 [Alphaproteobacteria bacterium]|nr:hypothetical protein [Alphaproteobacteria bacterium]
MKRFISFMLVSLCAVPAIAASSARRSMSDQMMAAPRAVASKAQISSGAMVVNPSPTPAVASAPVEEVVTPQPTLAVTPEVMVPVQKNNREAEKLACISNNIGVGNTFVWASRYSNTSNYSSMVEDVENPENNTCFVRIEMKSADPKISVSDIAPLYYEMGRTITCGSWADEGKMKQRILDAKKSGRTWATIGGAVGGAGVGVGAMELFGNRLIGGKVMGQKALEGTERLRSQLLALKEKDISQYNEFIAQLSVIKKNCNDAVWGKVSTEKPKACETYVGLFDLAN